MPIMPLVYAFVGFVLFPIVLVILDAVGMFDDPSKSKSAKPPQSASETTQLLELLTKLFEDDFERWTKGYDNQDEVYVWRHPSGASIVSDHYNNPGWTELDAEKLIFTETQKTRLKAATASAKRKRTDAAARVLAQKILDSMNSTPDSDTPSDAKRTSPHYS